MRERLGRSLVRFRGASLGLLLALGACAPANMNGDGGLTQCPSGTAEMQRLIFVPRCGSSGCHAADMPSAGLDLASPDLESRLVGRPALGCFGDTLIVAGQADSSLMYRKIADANPACGMRMPLAMTPMPDFEIACVRDWINGLSPTDAGTPDAAVDAPMCPSGTSNCGTSCVDTQRDNANCGACGAVCPPSSQCNGGACVCAPGQIVCGTRCVDAQADPMNCGACGRACTTGMLCSAGMCIRGTCPTGTTMCSGACVNLNTSVSNCGMCGRACSAGASCVMGVCGCPAGTTMCGTVCTNTTTDAMNCGACGRACMTGQSCAAGMCSTTCPAGQTACSGRCVDVSTDTANCGRCGNACPAGQGCTAGACASCGAAVSFASQLQPILTATCTTGCHGGVRPSAGLDLTSGRSRASLLMASTECSGRVRVAPGSVANSYLINKLTGVGMCMGNQMPARGTSLPAAQLDLFRAWICQGAPNN